VASRVKELQILRPLIKTTYSLKADEKDAAKTSERSKKE
jgi:hypothetical protein